MVLARVMVLVRLRDMVLARFMVLVRVRVLAHVMVNSLCYGVSPCYGVSRVMSCWRGSHGLSARRARRTKSRGPKGLQLEVGAQRAPRLLVIHICIQAPLPQTRPNREKYL